MKTEEEQVVEPYHHVEGAEWEEPLVGDTIEWKLFGEFHTGKVIGVVYAEPGVVRGGCTTLVVQCERHTLPCTVRWGKRFIPNKDAKSFAY